ncbi:MULTISPECIES: hypothetical protein [Achromobacter]|uniref:Uncharacterized protein n=1 Tax=Achromobacter spanius TaxID=217203 RepID=A0ABY8GRQ1_9BURK|nr:MULTISPECIES: hypothetical protein [Achromobacter]WAI83229.1 hypothetical protein N8Z00_27670 [Achromobacter spanius]WEX93314.1 hypothetical protein N3Z32_22265 [Achromobacter sp. SS2-2022]WFP07528.1 hypothetical protein P8T11_24985 [Achromobacter spanius]
MKRLLKDRDNAVAALVIAGVLVGLIFGYGDRQQRDEHTQTTLTAKDDGRPTAYASKD